MQNIKLSPAQKDVIWKMREGITLIKSTSPPYSARFQDEKIVKAETCRALKDAGLIFYMPINSMRNSVELTELGRTVDIG